MITKATWFSIIIAIILVGTLGWWLNQIQTKEAFHINALTEYGNSLPVYAQFNVAERITLANPIKVTKISIPLWIPSDSQGQLVVTIYANNNQIAQQKFELAQLAATNSQRTTLQIPIDSSQLLAGTLDVELAAPELDAHFPDKAPRVFIEVDDQAFPSGNYRIAHNEKSGDIALAVEQQLTNFELYRHKWQQKPAYIWQRVGQMSILALLIMSIPHLIRYIWQQRPTRQKSTDLAPH